MYTWSVCLLFGQRSLKIGNLKVLVKCYCLIQTFSISINFSHYIYKWCLPCRYVFILNFCLFVHFLDIYILLRRWKRVQNEFFWQMKENGQAEYTVDNELGIAEENKRCKLLGLNANMTTNKKKNIYEWDVYFWMNIKMRKFNFLVIKNIYKFSIQRHRYIGVTEFMKRKTEIIKSVYLFIDFKTTCLKLWMIQPLKQEKCIHTFSLVHLSISVPTFTYLHFCLI